MAQALIEREKLSGDEFRTLMSGGSLDTRNTEKEKADVYKRQVVNEERSLAANLIEEFRKAGRGTDFISPDDAVDAMDPNTLVIIVDTHVKYLLECAPLYERAKNVVVIDHHRKCVGHIDNSVIFYHEPYASSASELVSELLQYLDTDKENRLQPLEAQALLAGIMLDTRNFALHTGVRTFEAAAYLRHMGAQTQEVKKLFNSSFEDYAYKAQLVTDAEIYMGCAVVFADNLPEEMSVVTVSYTHLDVYKRQMQHCVMLNAAGDQMLFAEFGEFVCSPFDCPVICFGATAVSYTHLLALSTARLPIPG